jgi:hypothetical protein
MTTVEKTLAQGWPGRSVRTRAEIDQTLAHESGPVPGQGALGGERWFLVWNRDGLGECCCWRGTVRADGVAGVGSCQRPGKHPWVVRVDGELYGFVHGAADALEWEELQDTYGPSGGARQLAVTLDGLIVVDIDGPRALRDFARMAHTVPKGKILGVSTSPRGYHVWLDCPGWNQKALNQWMSQWLSGVGFAWSGTDVKAAGRRGLMVDVRTGVNRYAVWPGSSAQRRWLKLGEFGREIGRQLTGVLPGWIVPQAAGDQAPWAVDTGDAWLAGWIAERHSGAEIDVEGYSFQGVEAEMDSAWAEMERGLQRLERMGPGQGRNNALNRAAYYGGAKAVMAGHPLEVVRARLIEVGEQVGTHGVAATVASGLRSGLDTLKKQTQAQPPLVEG